MKINLIGLGGGGCNVVSYLEKNIDLGEGKLDFYLLDTSVNSNHSNIDKGNFYHIKSSDIGGEELNGSGGEQTTNVGHISSNIISFLNEKKLHNSNDLNVVVFSASGGSGSAAAPHIFKHLLKEGANVTGIMITDSTNYKYADNSAKTIERLNTIGKKIDYLSLITFNNKKYIEAGGDKIALCNDDILSEFRTLTVFVSGDNIEIDDTDMKLFFNPTKYKNVQVEKGLYGLTIGNHPNTRPFPKGVEPIIGRTLYNKISGEEVISPFSDFPFRQFKEGRTSSRYVDRHADMGIIDSISYLYEGITRDRDEFTVHKKIDTIPVADNEEDDLFL